MIKTTKILCKSIALLCLAACGSGSSGGASNAAPLVSNPGDLSVTEGETAVTSISASDSNGDALAFSLSGDDAAVFSISNNGTLTFLRAPTFADPDDSDNNNEYRLTVNVTDGSATTSVALTISVLEKVSDFDQGVFQDSGVYANLCGDPRTGTDPFDGSAFPDRAGSFEDENNWLRANSNDLYLWYDEIEDVDPEDYADDAAGVADYFQLMKTFATTPSGAAKDRFHFSYDTLVWKQLSQAGVSAGYGAKWILKSSSPPRQILVAFTEPNSPARAANLARGAEVITADGVDVVNGTDTDTLNAAFFPETTGETHTFEVRDLGSSTVRTISMTSASITKDPVQNVEVLSTDSGFVGYLTFNDHIATAEAELVNAFESLRDSNIEDLILDLRYNGGGYLDIANELAYMIAGPNATSGRTFESQQFNDKHPSVNPVTGASLVPRSFHNQAQGFSVDRGVLLPYLDLSRVYVLTSGNTCSASEAIINGLRGIDVEVIQIGTTTCGKPYGFYEMANCGTSYFSIQFKGVNAKGYGDYSDGFSPSNLATIEGEPVPGCAVADDLGNPLGNSNEAMLKAALAYRASPGTCPALPASGNPEPLLGYEGLQPSAVGVISEPRFPGRLVRQPTVQ